MHLNLLSMARAKCAAREATMSGIEKRQNVMRAIAHDVYLAIGLGPPLSIHIANIADVHSRRALTGPGMAQPGSASWLEFSPNDVTFQRDGHASAGSEWQ
jgi:hypothetical protein